MTFTESRTVEQTILNCGGEDADQLIDRLGFENRVGLVGSPMTLTELQAQIAIGEDSRRQFKRDVTNADSLAAEMSAFANSEGGTIFLGVADGGSLPGMSWADVARLNHLLGAGELTTT